MDFFTFSLIAGAIVLVYLWIRDKLNYWQNRGVVTLGPNSSRTTQEFLLQQNSFADRSLICYREFKRKKLKYGGLYFLFAPLFVPVDVDIIKSVMQNDFSHFVNRSTYVNEKGDPLSGHLFSMRGGKWKILRAKLTPTFTSGKMKMMFETLILCANRMMRTIDNEIGNTVNIKDKVERFTIDAIGKVFIGVDCNSIENPDSDFRKKGTAFFERNIAESLRFLLLFNFPKFMKRLNVNLIPKDISDFFMETIKETVSCREKNNISRKDFLDLLIQLKNGEKLIEEDKITLEVLAAQVFLFFEAGFVTSSTTIAFCLYEMAKNMQIQNKLRYHIKDVLAKHDGKFTYEAMNDMHFLEQTVNETLRKYPPVPELLRLCTKEYQVPGTDLIIEKETRVSIPVMGLHHDPEYYPEPEKFDPDRFSEENKRSRPGFTFIPFGEGPRGCIGRRFGLMQTKVGLVALLTNYEFSSDPKTKEPFEFNPKSFILSTKKGIWLNHKKIS